MTTNSINAIIHEAAQGHATDPIVLAAPMQRCGSTLIQRAINQGREAVIFGENFLFMEKFPFLLGGPFHDLDLKISETGAFMEVFRDSPRNQDATHLYPDYRAYLVSLMGGFYKVADQYKDEAEALGCARWGIKNQIADMQGFSNALRFLPNARLVAIYRDPVAAARSYRGRWPDALANPGQFVELARRWQVNMNFLLDYPGPKYMIRYEDLIRDRESVVSGLESFIECTISREAFATRVNAHLVKSQLEQHGGAIPGTYIKPLDLKDEEAQLLLDRIGPLAQRLGYGGTAP